MIWNDRHNFRKTSYFVLMVLLLLILLTFCAQVIDDEIPWMEFEWVGDTVGDTYHEHLAILLPVELEGISQSFSMQFDLGASLSSLYENTLKPFLADCEPLQSALDTLNREFSYNGKNMGAFKEVDVSVSGRLLHFKQVVYYEDYGREIQDREYTSEESIRIGTIGADVFQDKVLIIDFPEMRIAIEDSLPSVYADRIAFASYKPMGTRMRIPISIDGEETYLLFDTGASIFPLMVSPDRLARYGDTTVTADTISVRSWGRYITMWSVPMQSSIQFAGIPLDGGDRVYVNPQTDFKNFCDWNGFEGLTGNALFLDKILVIDTRNARFGILDEK